MKRDEFTPLKKALIKIKCVYRYDNRFILLDSISYGVNFYGVKKMHGKQQTLEIRPVRDEIIITAMKFVTYLTALFELRNTNFLPILSPYGTWHCKLVPSRNRVFVLSWFEAWKKKRYPKSFVAKLNDTEAEAAETQVWFDYALACNYIDLAE